MTRATASRRSEPPCSLRAAFREALLQLARRDSRIVCVDSDMGGLEDTFGVELPGQYLNLGIAEANMVGVAAGLAAAGKIPFVNAIASFVVLRAAEQVKVDIAVNGLPVKIVATHGGVSAGHLGPTHHALEDLALMRALPGMTVVVPADPAEARHAVEAVATDDRPAYIRLGRDEPAPLLIRRARFRIGEAVLLRPGGDITIAACGPRPVALALEAAAGLERTRTSARVLNIHTLQPLDVEAIVAAAQETRGLVTIEEHRAVGGLGSAIAEAVTQAAPCRVIRVAVRDPLTASVGDQSALLERSGMTLSAVMGAAARILAESV
jgi:transketolase